MTAEGRGSYTPFVRGRQFAATARGRVDPGLRFTDPPLDSRLQRARPGHKIALHSVAGIDDQVLHLLRLAYDQNP